jgi:hypothetical protein
MPAAGPLLLLLLLLLLHHSRQQLLLLLPWLLGLYRALSRSQHPKLLHHSVAHVCWLHHQQQQQQQLLLLWLLWRQQMCRQLGSAACTATGVKAFQPLAAAAAAAAACRHYWQHMLGLLLMLLLMSMQPAEPAAAQTAPQGLQQGSCCPLEPGPCYSCPLLLLLPLHLLLLLLYCQLHSPSASAP